MTKGSISANLLFFVAIILVYLVIWLTVKTEMLYALIPWMVIVCLIGMSSWGSYYYKKITGSRDQMGRAGLLVGIAVANVVMSIVLGVVYLFQIIF